MPQSIQTRPRWVGSFARKRSPRATSTTRSSSPTHTPARVMPRARPRTRTASVTTAPRSQRGRGFSSTRPSTSTPSRGRAGKKSSPTRCRPTEATWEIPAARLVLSAKPGWTAATTPGPWPASRRSPRWQACPGASFACFNWCAADAALDPASGDHRSFEFNGAALIRGAVAQANRPDGPRARGAAVDLAQLRDHPTVIADLAGAGVATDKDVQLDVVPAGAEHRGTGACRRGNPIVQGKGPAR